jgi:hypothetical protein
MENAGEGYRGRPVVLFAGDDTARSVGRVLARVSDREWCRQLIRASDLDGLRRALWCTATCDLVLDASAAILSPDPERRKSPDVSRLIEIGAIRFSEEPKSAD